MQFNFKRFGTLCVTKYLSIVSRNTANVIEGSNKSQINSYERMMCSQNQLYSH